MKCRYWSKDTVATLTRLGVNYTMAVRTNTTGLARAIAAIAEEAWAPIEYPEGGVAAVAETTYKGIRLVLRRTRLVCLHATLWPNWRHFAFLTDLGASATDVDAFHRQHATVELAIDDREEGAGMEYCPSGSFSANGHGSAAPCSPTTWSAGRLPWATSSNTASPSSWRAPCEPVTSPCPPAWSTARAVDATHANAVALGGALYHCSH